MGVQRILCLIMAVTVNRWSQYLKEFSLWITGMNVKKLSERWLHPGGIFVCVRHAGSGHRS